MKSGELVAIENEMAGLNRIAELSLRGGFMEEFGFGGQEMHMFFMEFPRMLQHLLSRTLMGKKKPRRRSPTSDTDDDDDDE